MDKLINSLLASGDSTAFREPVDWRGLGLHDYLTIIKHPMDLGTVKRRLDEGAYRSLEECAADVRLIWHNCRTYNCGGEPRSLHKAADALSKRFETRYAKLRAQPQASIVAKGKKRRSGTGIGDALASTPTDEQRQRLGRHLANARMEDVTAAVHEIDRRCPEALVRNGDLIDVDVSALDLWTFSAVERIVAPYSSPRRPSRVTERRDRRTKRPKSNESRRSLSNARGNSDNVAPLAEKGTGDSYPG